MTWTRQRILQELRRLHKKGQVLAYNSLARTKQDLVSAAAYHYGSYRRAVEQAGIDYADVLRRPRWTKARIVGLIRQAKKNGHALHWSAVTSRRDELAKAAFASLQPRLFGRWKMALTAAGLDSADVALYRRWDRKSIAEELHRRSRGKKPLNSGAIQASDPGLHAAAVRHFGSFDLALEAAKVDPADVRMRRRWSRDEVVASIKAAAKRGQAVSDSQVRKHSPALYGASVRLFGSFVSARKAAGIDK
ncbi:MAG TPA: hypothetical protein VL992_07745 [Tepidisphaeraceae bacterium]|nr:hypothetical protein [Tepidisphaeraceae bacterium]